ncbi:uncharacterized protein LOC130777336 isoform X3 [Actinidia eriantha]|uniref:uncharacterized protein LOC130777336 isoform X3 n=1 Tax=Actinidia eriantha TaxID=165200 RepID=UPI0025902650|nr:uncharacterized protein LOC130777336 isoform X3 [Actinidia eriantha]
MGPMQGPHLAGRIGPSRERNYVYSVANGDWDAEEFRVPMREKQMERMDCRICHEEDFTKKMETPCACNGSLKFAHRKCVRLWCNEKKNTICEIFHQPPMFLALKILLLISERAFTFPVILGKYISRGLWQKWQKKNTFQRQNMTSVRLQVVPELQLSGLHFLL